MRLNKRRRKKALKKYLARRKLGYREHAFLLEDYIKPLGLSIKMVGPLNK